MHRFKKYLKEQALNRDQEAYIDHFINWDDPEKRDVNFSDHLFDKQNPPEFGGKKGNVINPDTVTFDVEKPKIEPEKHIRDYLGARGYKIHDYAAGLAVREGSKRPISIGKILSKPHEPPSTQFNAIAPEWIEHRSNEFRRSAALSDFNSSDVRAAMKTPLQIMITRDPYKVAGMSTGTPRWKSCMFLGTCPTRDLLDDGGWHDEEEKIPYHQQADYQRPGQNAKRMQDELLSGTHVAYLIGAGDHDLKNPFARISLKPYHSENIAEKIRRLPMHSLRYGYDWRQIKPDHTILRPSVNTYTSHNIMRSGTGIMDFFKTHVEGLVRQHFPMRHEFYHLDPMSYKDGGDLQVWSSEEK